MTRLLKESSLAAKKSHGSRSGTPFDSPLDLPARTAWTRLAAWTILLASTILFCWPLLTNPKLPDGSDVTYHAQRSHGFYEALGEGVLYPRWLADANRGFGGPDFLVYPPLGYYLVAGTSFIQSSWLVAEALGYHPRRCSEATPSPSGDQTRSLAALVHQPPRRLDPVPDRKSQNLGAGVAQSFSEGRPVG